MDGYANASWAVRRDWSDGAHEFIRRRDTEIAALGELERDQKYWRRNPLRPQLSVVTISASDFELHGRHRRSCKAPDCPRAVIVEPEAGA